jgi:uncharacterized repeat protein (TIGR02543 family)
MKDNKNMNRKQKRFLARLQRSTLSLLVAGAIAAGNISAFGSSPDPEPYADDITGDILRIYGGGGGGGGWVQCSGSSGSGGNAHIEFWVDEDTLHFRHGDGNTSNTAIAGQDGINEYNGEVFRGGRSGHFNSQTRNPNWPYDSSPPNLPLYMESFRSHICSQNFTCSCPIQREGVLENGDWIYKTIINCSDCHEDCWSNDDCLPGRCACVILHDCFSNNHIATPVGSYNNNILCSYCQQDPCEGYSSCFTCINCGENPCEEIEYCFVKTYICEKAPWMNTGDGFYIYHYSYGRGPWNGGGGGDASVATIGNITLSTILEMYAGSGGQAVTSNHNSYHGIYYNEGGLGGDGGNVSVEIGDNLTVPILFMEAGDGGDGGGTIELINWQFIPEIGWGWVPTGILIDKIGGDGGDITLEVGGIIDAQHIILKSGVDGESNLGGTGGTAALKASTLKAASDYTMSLIDGAYIDIDNFIFDITGSTNGDVLLAVTGGAVPLTVNTATVLTGIADNIKKGDEIVLISRVSGDFTPVRDITIGNYTFDIDLNSAGNQLIATVTKTIFDITFNPNGGSVTPAGAETEADGKLASLPTPTRSGQSFVGWFTSLTGGVQVTADTVFSGNSTIYARWTPASGGGVISGGGTSSINAHIVTFNPNGGTVTPASRVTGGDGRLSALPTPARSGHAFIGWFTSLTGGVEVTTNTVFTGDSTVFARWGDASGYGVGSPSGESKINKTGINQPSSISRPTNNDLYTTDYALEILREAAGLSSNVPIELRTLFGGRKQLTTADAMWVLKWAAGTEDMPSYVLTVHHHYDRGFIIRFPNALNEIVSYQDVVSEVFLDIFNLRVITGSVTQYKSIIDVCMNPMSSTKLITTPCFHNPPHETYRHSVAEDLVRQYGIGSNIISRFAWTGYVLPGNQVSASFSPHSELIGMNPVNYHVVVMSVASVTNNSHHTFTNENDVKMEYIYELLHETAHQIGARDHYCYFRTLNPRCINPNCFDCYRDVRKPVCVMSERMRDIEERLKDGRIIFCTECVGPGGDVTRHLLTHHLS